MPQRDTRREDRPALLQPPGRAKREWHGSASPHAETTPCSQPPLYRRRLYEDARAGFGELRVRDIMSHDVIAIHPDELVQHAAHIMAQWHCGALPVIDERETLIGMITDRDIAVRVVARGRDPLRSTVANCMTRDPHACQGGEHVVDCLREMAYRRLRRVPVVNEHGMLVGIVSYLDLVRYAALHGDAREHRAACDALCAVCEPDRA